MTTKLLGWYLVGGWVGHLNSKLVKLDHHETEMKNKIFGVNMGKHVQNNFEMKNS